MAKQNYSTSRKFHMVINNFDKHGYSKESIIEELRLLFPTYFCFAFEIGKNGTLHVHIFIYRKSPIRFRTLKKHFPEAHIVACSGTSLENRQYIRKEGKHANKSHTSVEDSFYEEGDIPIVEDNKPDIEKAIDLLKNGSDINEIIEEMPKMGTRVRQLEDLKQVLLKKEYMNNRRPVEVYYIKVLDGSDGIEGVYSYFDMRDVCEITEYESSGTFDEYDTHKVIVFNDFYSSLSLRTLLKYMSGKPIALPARFRNRVACFTDLFIISEIAADEQFKSEKYKSPKLYEKYIRSIDHYFEYENGKLYEYIQEGDIDDNK
ncbi:MAG: hypothetical protein IJ889_05820 [Eubacterium sp.]|nr:hypothetical protein [Eubacterium sp.]